MYHRPQKWIILGGEHNWIMKNHTSSRCVEICIQIPEADQGMRGLRNILKAITEK